MQHQDDPLSLDTLCTDFGEQVYRVAFGMTGDAVDAEAVTMNTFVRIARNPHIVRAEADPMGALYGVTLDESWEVLRRRAGGSCGNLDSLPVDFDADGRLTNVTDRTQCAEYCAMADDIEACAAAAIQDLPEGYREPLVLRDLIGLSYEVMARSTGLDAAELKAHLNRARLYLRRRLDEFVSSSRPVGAARAG